MSDERGSASDATPIFPPPPVGVRFGETLEGKRVRLAYSWERIREQGLAAGEDNITAGQTRALGFMQTPRALEITVHTFQMAYAPHPRATLVAELPFIQKELETVGTSAMGFARSEVQTEGIGDVGFALVVPFIRKGFESSQVHIGIDIPTGAIRRGGDDLRLPYDLQIGNGSWDFEWGWTYRGETARVSWGGQVVGRHPLARNGLKYRTGSRVAGTVWGGVRIAAGLSVSLRVEWEKYNNIQGFDRTLRPDFDPSENALTHAGNRITLAPGISLDIPQLNHQRIAVEMGIPVHQQLDGPQLERDWTMKTVWQWVY
ncbi:MAG: hypothetical protein GY910_16490 [bacterium]|nr:hypothetical protein [bacterium]